MFFVIGVFTDQLKRNPSQQIFSKLESSGEAALWRRIFLWTEKQLGLRVGTIKACVLIENVLATFQMEEILWELRDHSAGLNCGVWDYSASFVAKFGERKEFVLPDRSKYVNMEREFLSSYRRLVVETAHGRGAPATGGMAADMVLGEEKVVEKVVREKRREVEAGVDGFLIYDPDLAGPCRRLWAEVRTVRGGPVPGPRVTQEMLLSLPSGGVTTDGLKLNIAVTVVFISSWLRERRGCLAFQGRAEDSATAEISRCQVWQWIHHGARLEETGQLVTASLVRRLATEFTAGKQLETAGQIFLDIVTRREMPEFITTLLSDSYLFRFS